MTDLSSKELKEILEQLNTVLELLYGIEDTEQYQGAHTSTLILVTESKIKGIEKVLEQINVE